MGPARAAIEPCRHIRASEGMLEQPEVAARRAHENRHLVECDPLPCFLQQAPRDLDALTPLAWRGKELDGPVGRACRWLLVGVEQIAAQRGEIAPVTIAAIVAATADRRQLRNGAIAARRGCA